MFHIPAHKQLDPAKQAGQIVSPLMASIGVAHQVKAPSADFAFRDHGSVWILIPLTAEGSQWISDSLPEDAQRWAGGVAIQPRGVDAVVNRIQECGLEVV